MLIRMLIRKPFALLAFLIASSVAACAGAPDAPQYQAEVVAASFQTRASAINQTFPAMLLSITASGSSSLGNAITITATTVDGKAAASPLLVNEGSHDVCVTATSTTAVAATECRTVPVTWPRFEGRAVLYDARGAVTPPGLTLTLDDGTAYAINSVDGSFSVASAKAEFPGAKLVFSGASAVTTSLVRTQSVGPINVVMLPAQLTIPSCSVYRGQTLPLELEKAYTDLGTDQSSYFDRAGTLRRDGRIVVASWDMASIPVALSDTGDASKQFTPQDSAEVATVLSMLTSYVCQDFHLASLIDARRDGIVIVKDAAFSALGAHSMALPSTRGNYMRAEVVLRRIMTAGGAVRDSVRRTMMHEFFHVLGFGHTCAWPTVMTTGTACGAETYAFVPSPPDVAHFFAMRYARQGERALSTLQSLGPAYMGALVRSGKSEFPLPSYFVQP